MRTNIKSKVGLYLIGVTFIATGILIAILMLIIGKSEANKTKEWIPTKAVIQDITKEIYRRSGKTITDYDVYVSYTYDGTEYEDILNHYSSSMHVGDEVTIYVNPDNHSESSSGTSYVFIIIGAAFGIMFPLLGVSVIVATNENKDVYVGDKHSSDF